MYHPILDDDVDKTIIAVTASLVMSEKEEKNTSYGLTRRVTRDHINEGHDSPSASRSQVSHFLDMCSSLEIYVIIDSCKKSRGSMMA